MEARTLTSKSRSLSTADGVDLFDCPVCNETQSTYTCIKVQCCVCQQRVTSDSHKCAKYNKDMHAICGSVFCDDMGNEAPEGYGQLLVCTQRRCQNAMQPGAPYAICQKATLLTGSVAVNKHDRLEN